MVFIKYIVTGIVMTLLANNLAMASHHHEMNQINPVAMVIAHIADNPFAGGAPYKAQNHYF